MDKLYIEILLAFTVVIGVSWVLTTKTALNLFCKKKSTKNHTHYQSFHRLFKNMHRMNIKVWEFPRTF